LISNNAALYLVAHYVIFMTFSLCAACKINVTLSLF